MENSELVKNALRYVDKSFAQSGLTIEEVAKNAGFSVDYFNRIFRAHTGFNVMEYIRFKKLNNAAIQLRRSDKDIIQIALDAGYESHDGFTRAFKAQYGKTPSEFRSTMKDEPITFADLALNATAAGQFKAEFPEFDVIDSDEAIDNMLSQDAKRFGYDAISIKWNGSCVLADKKLSESGGYIAADMFFPDGPYLNLKLHDISYLREYTEKLLRINPWVISVAFDSDTDIETVRKTLDGIRYKKLVDYPEAMYLGEEQTLPKESAKYVFRFLEPTDIAAVDEWISAALKNGDGGLRQSVLTDRNLHPDDQPIGMFSDGKLIGIARLCLQEAHGFKLNNCISTMVLPEYRNLPERKWLYQAALNEVLKLNYIPFEDTALDENALNNNGFTAFDLGFEIVNTHYIIDF